MGLEYIADVSNKVFPAATSTLIADLIAQPDWVVRERLGNKISFMFSASAPRPEGPEDFRVEIDASEIYVAFYGGTRDLEHRVIAFMTNELASRGMTVAFEEP